MYCNIAFSQNFNLETNRSLYKQSFGIDTHTRESQEYLEIAFKIK